MLFKKKKKKKKNTPHIQPQRGTLPSGAAQPQAPFGRSESPSISRVSLLIQRRTGLPFRCSRPTAPFGRSVTPPSVIPSCAACSVADGAPTPGAAEPLAPFGCMGALHPMRQTAPCIRPQGGLSPPVQQSRKLPSDAVRVPPSVASLCLFSVGRGSPSGAADPRLPSVAVWRLRLSFRVALRARWRTGLPLPVQQSRWLPSVVMGALLPTRQTAPCTKPQGGLSPPVQQSRSSLRTQWESLHQSHLFAYSASDGAPLPVQQTHGSLRSQCDASVCHFELRCVLGGGRGSHSRCSRAAGSLRL